MPGAIGSYAEIHGDQLWLRALVGSPDGSRVIRAERRAPLEKVQALGEALAEELLRGGARKSLTGFIRKNPPH